MARPISPSEPHEDPSPWRPPPPVTWRDRLDSVTGQLPISPLRLLGSVVAVLAAAGAVWWLLRPPPPPIETVLPMATDTPPGSPTADPEATTPGSGAPATTSTAAVAELVVQSAGAVAEPGVYRLPSGARVDDLVSASGGLGPDADVDRINLAAPVGDGERVWFPRRGDEAPPDVVAGTNSTPAPSAGNPDPPDGPVEVVDLNTADATELEALPGVGPATAAAILSHREQNGPFSSVDELLDVRGIGDAKLEQIRPMAKV